MAIMKEIRDESIMYSYVCTRTHEKSNKNRFSLNSQAKKTVLLHVTHPKYTAFSRPKLFMAPTSRTYQKFS